MKKKVFAGMLMMILVLASVMGVSAADSKSQPVYVSGASIGSYEIITGTKEFEGVKAEVLKQMEELEAKKTVSLGTEIDNALKGKTMITEFFDLHEIGTHEACASRGYHTVELTVSALTSSCKNVVVLHYSQVRSAWEVITPKVDGNKITIDVKDLSPVAIYADVTESGAAGTSPSTEGTTSTWMLWTAAALIVLGAGVVVSQKKKH